MKDALEKLLRTRVFGRSLVVRERTTSTMDDARALALSGAAAGTTVIAAEQTAGRGRLGRTFVSPPGGLYVTVILSPPGDPADAWRCGFAAALAARHAVLAARGPELTFDWPNDLILGARKVGGVLLELLDLTGGAARSFALLLGLGLNLGVDPREVDPDAAGPAGPIFGSPRPDSRPVVAALFLESLEDLVPRVATEDGWRRVLELVSAVSRAARGYAVAVRSADGELLRGAGVGIREDGALLLRKADGATLAVRYGERVYSDR